MTMERIKNLCENKQLTHAMLVDEIYKRVVKSDLLCAIWEKGMKTAKTDEERKAVMYMVLNANEECREIFATYLYYQMKD